MSQVAEGQETQVCTPQHLHLSTVLASPELHQYCLYRKKLEGKWAIAQAIPQVANYCLHIGKGHTAARERLWQVLCEPNAGWRQRQWEPWAERGRIGRRGVGLAGEAQQACRCSEQVLVLVPPRRPRLRESAHEHT